MFLSWSAHIDSICSKGRELVGLLCRKFSTNTDSKSLLELYTMLVRSHLEYAAQVWSPVTNNDIKKIENLQKFALKMCVNNWNLSYQTLLDLADLPSLENHRLYLKLCTLYKILYGHLYFPSDIFIPAPDRNNSCLPKLYQLFARTNCFKSSFVPNTIFIWNNLPLDALTSYNIYSFKLQIAPLFL